MSSYSDTDLAVAVAAARSWRGVLRALGLPPQSSAALRAARARAAGLGIDVRHFTGQRRWSDDELAEAVRASRSWTEVLDRLGLARGSGSARALLKAHAARLRLEVSHLERQPDRDPTAPFPAANPLRLDRAGPLLAAAWFTLRGYDVAWPLEPTRYDLMVTDVSRAHRVQVKTTTSKVGESWAVRISTNRPSGTVVYTPEEVDYFFIVDGDLTCYLIPLSVVGGYQVIYLQKYAAFAVKPWLDAA